MIIDSITVYYFYSPLGEKKSLFSNSSYYLLFFTACDLNFFDYSVLIVWLSERNTALSLSVSLCYPEMFTLKIYYCFLFDWCVTNYSASCFCLKHHCGLHKDSCVRYFEIYLQHIVLLFILHVYFLILLFSNNLYFLRLPLKRQLGSS